ncbi:T9SS type A sorting domain-containing protein [Cyclobacterium amurskyense]|jgi:hypothetical protein|uniref:Secretion system C-terminal sorting domain-containing protein n=1 Tax=Cyclobacterium amurskyense TaxID=320787 RepID=A0A0H4PWI8_9BACT|nr:hypothetical protein [Cyclobacterium amurskyense]AKP52742.1 hypothetical protein CA2015_3352 [Cyclobacterium amurskyense]|tara:strand:+ start:3623 stop:4057 length:435 start_codon:yes stop_codon:yes gene_type:complete
MNEEKYTVRLTIIVLLFLVLSFPGKFSAVAQSVSRSFETKISFPKELNTPTINFNLQSIGNKKFKLVLDKPNAQLTNVKIFDILGNLILQDQLLPDDGLQKNYDFTHLNSRIFVVEVGNAKYNKTKSIYANPHGTMEKEANLDE